jgi:Ran GTPase-activating protein (RanGAP) involved in mRNA processing and transport
MAIIDNVLKPKSQEEILDLEKRGFRKNAGKWKFNVNIGTLISEYETDEDTKKFKDAIIELLKGKVADVGIFADDKELAKFKDVVRGFEKLRDVPNADELDSVMEALYDWADDNDVWVESF